MRVHSSPDAHVPEVLNFREEECIMKKYLVGLFKHCLKKVIDPFTAKFHFHYVKDSEKTELDVTCELGQLQQETRLE